MYEFFTERATKIMQLANQEGQRLRNEQICTEHILLALAREGSGVGANVLIALQVDLRAIRPEIWKLVACGPDETSGKLPLSGQAWQVIEYAIIAAQELDHNYVGSEHLLLGMLREKKGVAAKALENLGVKLETAKVALKQLKMRWRT